MKAAAAQTGKEGRPQSAAHAALKSFGITRPSETPLLVPESYQDFTEPCRDLSLMAEGEPTCIVARVQSAPSRSSSGPPRFAFILADDAGNTYQAAVFGDDPTPAKGIVKGQTMAFVAKAKDRAGRRWITVVEVVEGEWMGRVRPVYPVRKAGSLRMEVRAIIHGYLPHMVHKACDFLVEQLAALAPMPTILKAVGCDGWSLQQLLWQIHAPASLEYGEHARAAYIRIAALGMRLRTQRSVETQPATPLFLPSLDDRIRDLPFALTSDQRRAVDDMRERLSRPYQSRSIISGDVGTGKTAVCHVLAAAVSDLPQGRVLIMAPTYPLAKQLYDGFVQVYPEVPASLVAGNEDDADPRLSRVVVGTSAVLTRDIGEFVLVVVDEQQRWSRGQREHYLTKQTHLMEMSATCIPRTVALMRLGRVEVSELRQTHAEKVIHTHLWVGNEHVGPMFRQIREAVANKRPVLVIYPKKEGDERKSGGAKNANADKQDAPGGAIDERHSVEKAVPRWEKLFPGRVRAITGDDEDDSKAEALLAIANGDAEILLATTVVEVGISLPNLHYIVIVMPDRYGMTTLHQLRGRVARNGGEGHCHLWAPGQLSEKAKERLDVFVTTADGFALAEADLKIRGSGDLSVDSSTQSGADETFLYGAPMSIDVIEEVADLWEQLQPETSRETR